MKKSAILALFICHCAFCFSQQLIFSRKFETIAKNAPISIINSSPDFFYLLRYNKSVHDITIERRAKPTAEIIGFSALKLDEVNADWFDYGKLDYLFFEQDKKLYFLFEKVLNTKKIIYLKIIDSLNKSSGFIELATLALEKGVIDFGFEFKTTFDNNILIIASQTYHNSVIKTALLFNVKKCRMEWFKKLAIENDYTGYSTSFVCNSANDLFFVQIKSHVGSYERKYMHHMQMALPVIVCDNLTLVGYLHNDPVNIHLKPLLNNLSKLNSVNVSVMNDEVIVQSHYAVEEIDSRYKKVFFSTVRMSKDLNSEVYATTTRLNEASEKQLTFYDGSDSKYAGDKQYSPVKISSGNSYNYQLSERREDPYYKELLAVRTDLATGAVLNQHVIMRKSAGPAMTTFHNDNLYVITREAPSNLKKPVGGIKYNKFRKENSFWGSNIVMYTITKEGSINRDLVSANLNLGIASLKYYGDNQDNIVFYQLVDGYERFAILELNRS